MKLELRTPHLSISRLVCSNELPDFIVLTGANGSGKTHLLRAIESGAVLVDGISKSGAQARFFDANSIVPNDVGSFSSQALKTLRNNMLGQLDGFKNQCRNDLNQNVSVQLKVLRDISPLLDLTDPLNVFTADFSSVLSESDGQRLIIESNLDQVKQRYAAIEPSYIQNFGVSAKLDKFAKAANKRLIDIDKDSIETEAIDLWGDANVFQQNLGQIFVAYRDMFVRNQLIKLARQENSNSQAKVFNSEEFRTVYGEPPWDFINRIFENANLPFYVTVPDMTSYEDLTVELCKRGIKQAIPFSSLSSGEKVLMSFALCLYQARDGRQAVQYPELLLFDEIDAPLHPFMVKSVIETVRQELVHKKGIKVILATHSPTTVAIAPEESVYAMYDSSRIEKISKDAALRVLTYGLPTLAISIEARRQVLVESRKDALVYEKIFSILKTTINSERSLEFIAASGADKQGHEDSENGGCAVVKNLVKQLADCGNQSVYGLIDWDTRNQKSERVKVIAEGQRYSIENCVLDPCLIGLLVVKDDIQEARKEGLVSNTESYRDLLNAQASRLQLLADEVCKILGFNGERRVCNYSDAVKLELPLSILKCHGHKELAGKILARFKCLRAKCRDDSALVNKVVDQIFSDRADLIPQEFRDVFESVLNQ